MPLLLLLLRDGRIASNKRYSYQVSLNSLSSKLPSPQEQQQQSEISLSQDFAISNCKAVVLFLFELNEPVAISHSGMIELPLYSNFRGLQSLFKFATSTFS